MKTTRTLHAIAKEISNDWGSKVNYGAKPYLMEMHHISDIDDSVGCENGRTMVLYFLSNASSWRGETAKRVKLELKSMVGLK